MLSLSKHLIFRPYQLTKALSDKGEKAWRIEISDNGIEIEEKHFERLHSRNTYEGTGIGLTICQKVVHRHKGKIAVRSTLHEGTIFIITLLTGQPG